jgi:hypothetical protein
MAASPAISPADADEATLKPREPASAAIRSTLLFMG